VNTQTTQSREPKRFLPLVRTRTEPSGKANQDTEAGNHRQEKSFGRNENFQQGKRAPQTEELAEKSCASIEWTRANLMWNPKNIAQEKQAGTEAAGRILAHQNKQGE
jgi:hypothetical protein